MRLNNKVAVITGAAGVLGTSTAQRFAQEGAKLVLVDLNPARLTALAQTLEATHTATVIANVADAEDMQGVAQFAEQRFGQVDVFFANAGIEGVATQQFSDYPDEVFDQVMEVNVRGVYIGVKTMLPRMSKGGSVILTSSIMGMMGTPFNAAYAASKHAVIGIRRSCAMMAGPQAIRVNSIHPGFVDSEMLNRLIEAHPSPEAFRQGLENKTMFGRLTQASEVADAALFLASDDSRAITNHGLVVDCGTLN